jgi:hypothetical protein
MLVATRRNHGSTCFPNHGMQSINFLKRGEMNGNLVTAIKERSLLKEAAEDLPPQKTAYLGCDNGKRSCEEVQGRGMARK